MTPIIEGSSKVAEKVESGSSKTENKGDNTADKKQSSKPEVELNSSVDPKQSSAE